VFFPTFMRNVMKAGDGNVLVLTGSLRAGKTVLMRQMIAALIERSVDPTSAFYCNMKVSSYTSADLKALFEMYCRRYKHAPKDELFISYDEI